MALTMLKGQTPMLYDLIVQGVVSPAFGSSTLTTSTGRVAIIGQVWHPTVKTGTINIRKVHFRLGAVTFNALSTFRVSLQNVSLTAGPPYQPDGTQDQTYDYVGTGLTANAWNATGNLSADRAVDLSAISPGDANSSFLAVVLEYQAFTAADSIAVIGLNMGTGTIDTGTGGNFMVYNGATWGFVSNNVGIIALECDDGTYAFIENTAPITNLSTVSVASNGAIRAAGLRFRVPVELTIDAIGLGFSSPNGADGSIVLYDSDGTTVLRTSSIDNDSVSGTAFSHKVVRIPPVTLAANTYYRLVFESTTTTATTVNYADFNVAGLLDSMAGGQDFHWTQRDSAGVWTETTTRRPFPKIRLGSVHDGSGGGGLAIPVSGRICA